MTLPNVKKELGFGYTSPKELNKNFDSKLKIKQLACGVRHNVAIGTDGKIYTWGYNKFVVYFFFLEIIVSIY